MNEKGRNGAIDMLRGLTMFLMVTVNEFWRVTGVPHFLEHFDTMEDGMGLSDIVYPLFLFAMGLSIPYAIDRRYARGCSPESTLGHILSRTFALLVMGVFILNTERDFTTILGIGEGVYLLLMLAGFFLVWNSYPKDWRPARWLRPLGAVILLFLAVIYRSSKGGYMQAHWWGILGQIGWAYLFTATAYLLARKKPGIIAVLWCAAVLLNILTAPTRAGDPLLGNRNILSDFARALQLGNGHTVIMALGGTITTLAGRFLTTKSKARQAWAGIGAILLLLTGGFLSHRLQIISKNIGTLPWCLYVTAIGVAGYLLLRMLELRGWTRWFTPFRPAGTATLTVYMIPYLLACLWIFTDLEMPAWVSGWIGVAICALTAFLCIGITALLGKAGIKLKI
jgi:predicted acyltransferase